VTQIYQSILATKTAERAAAIAQEIARERPDLVALQEVLSCAAARLRQRMSFRISSRRCSVNFDGLGILMKR
jgi:endonuclease/exonuclease/phosphatase family metal-dependent hydrolase